mmetsp:Transcript_12365/g.20211  ORF Transcript_12365/g.20211 Transcript_12365/m.20211 type:complete len:105 (-) Transcript_12365:17-331(-)
MFSNPNKRNSIIRNCINTVDSARASSVISNKDLKASRYQYSSEARFCQLVFVIVMKEVYSPKLVLDTCRRWRGVAILSSIGFCCYHSNVIDRRLNTTTPSTTTW